MISQRKNLGKYAFTVAFMILLAFSNTSYWSLNQLKKNVESEFHTGAIIEKLSLLTTSLKGAEKESYEYTLTRSEHNLKAYNHAKEQFLQILKSLKTITADNPVYRKRFSVIELLASRKFTTLQKDEFARDEQKMKAITDNLHRLVDKMKDREKESSRQQRDNIVANVRLSFIRMGVGIALILIAAVLVILKMKHDITKRRQVEEDLRRSKKQAEDAYNQIEQVNAELKATYKKLMKTSHHAGMAEVATDILHNVGNVLNSINVSATLISEKIRNSEAVNLKKVADMIAEHRDNLTEFLAEDPKGKHIPDYLIEAGHHLVEEQEDILEKFTYLSKNIDHIKEIIKMQQSYGKVAGTEVTAKLDEVIEDAIHINAAGLDRSNIKIVRKYSDLGDVRIDRQKVLQILVNLIGNAKYAIAANEKEEKVLTIQSYRYGEQRMRIDVIDNGIGIAKENLKELFRHGFTTKKHGHGFGLHSGALAAKEMGGTLTAHSDGEGKGAIFTLELIFKSAGEIQCAV